MADLLDNLGKVISELETFGNLSIYENSYIKELDFQLTDISADFEYENEIYCGRGIALDPNLALKKAIYEVVERACFAKSGYKNTNGFAISDSFEWARRFAINELIEREIFLKHWTQERSFICFANERVDFLKQCFYRVYPLEIEINFFQSEITINKMNLYICRISGLKFEKKFGFFFGYGYKDTREESIDHCFFEAINTFSYDFEHNLLAENISLEEFFAKKKISFRDHGLLAKNITYALKVDSIYFNKLCECKFQNTDLIADDLVVNKIGVIFDLPLYCVKVESDDFINFDIGKSDESALPHPID